MGSKYSNFDPFFEEDEGYEQDSPSSYKRTKNVKPRGDFSNKKNQPQQKPQISARGFFRFIFFIGFVSIFFGIFKISFLDHRKKEIPSTVAPVKEQIVLIGDKDFTDKVIQSEVERQRLYAIKNIAGVHLTARSLLNTGLNLESTPKYIIIAVWLNETETESLQEFVAWCKGKYRSAKILLVSPTFNKQPNFLLAEAYAKTSKDLNLTLIDWHNITKKANYPQSAKLREDGLQLSHSGKVVLINEILKHIE